MAERPKVAQHIANRETPSRHDHAALCRATAQFDGITAARLLHQPCRSNAFFRAKATEHALLRVQFDQDRVIRSDGTPNGLRRLADNPEAAPDIAAPGVF